jgi:hypothetical protein
MGGLRRLVLCVALNEERSGRWLLRVGEVPEGHDGECDGKHGRVVGEFVSADEGDCVECGGRGGRFTPSEPGWPSICGACVVECARDAWMAMAFMGSGRNGYGQEGR